MKGENAAHTAIDRYIGLPIGILVKMVMNDTIKDTGINVSLSEKIYEPVLKELEEYGIVFQEGLTEINE